MDVEFRNHDLDRLETDPSFTAGLGRSIVRSFRKKLQAVRAAVDERDLRGLKSFRFEKLKGARSHQYSIRLNQQMRLILEIKPGNPKNTIIIVAIEDYH